MKKRAIVVGCLVLIGVAVALGFYWPFGQAQGWHFSGIVEIQEVRLGSKVGGTLSLPNGALSEQHHRTGPSVHQKADYGEPWIPIGRGGVAND